MQLNPTTRLTRFGYVGKRNDEQAEGPDALAGQSELFTIPAGVPTYEALAEAEMIEVEVSDTLDWVLSMDEESMPRGLVAMIHRQLQACAAIRHACGVDLLSCLSAREAAKLG